MRPSTAQVEPDPASVSRHHGSDADQFDPVLHVAAGAEYVKVIDWVKALRDKLQVS